MKIETEDLLTINQAMEAIGCTTRRGVYRTVARAREAGKETTVSLYGKTLIPRKMIAVLKEYYYPYYSEAHQRMVKQWGAAGGTQKRINAEKAARAAKRAARA